MLCALWAGSLWTTCGLVAPTLFAVLEDRQLAGRLAAKFFFAQTWIGVVIGVLLLALGSAGRIALPERWLVAVAAFVPLASELILGPLMDRSRAAGDMARFGLLHGLAGACFLVACGAVLAVAWKLSRPAG